MRIALIRYLLPLLLALLATQAAAQKLPRWEDTARIIAGVIEAVAREAAR